MSFKGALEPPCNYCGDDHSVLDCSILKAKQLMARTIYRVFEDFDRDSNHVASFGTRGSAEELANKYKGGMSSAHICEERVYDTFYEFNQTSPEARRENALKKLTKEDKEALGLS